MRQFLRSIPKTEWAGVGILLAVGAVLRLWQPDLGYLSLHTSRDLYRSLLFLRGVEFPLLGSELQYGGRVLGPLMYLLCAVPLAITMNPVGVAVYIALINLVLLGVVWLFVRAFFGRGVAFWTLAFYAVFPIEIAQLRFNWNPCFLPLTVAGAMIGLFQVAVRRRVWHLLTIVLFISLGLQLHISAAELILGVAVALLVARVRIPWKVWAASGLLVVVLFSPLIVHEATAKKSDLVEVVKSPDTHRAWSERYRFNPNGVRNFFYHTRLQMNERGEDLGFAYLEIVPLIGEKWLGRRWMAVLQGINAFSQIQLVFWFVGFGICLREVRRNRRRTGRGATSPDEPSDPAVEESRRRKLIYLTLIVWQVIPVVVLSFFNYHGFPGQPPTLAPIRYYLTTYPAPFITSAIGLMGVAGWAFSRATAPTLGRRLRAAVFALAGLLLVGHVVFDAAYLTVLGRSGRFLPYQFPNLAPNLRSVMEIREVLLDKAALDREAWFGRVHSQNLGLWFYGEVTFDWIVTQDPRSVTNSPPDPHLRWLLFSPFKEQTAPKLPDGATETRRWAVRDTGMTVVEYRVDDPDAAIPDNRELRNYYYADEPMRYLGPEKDLREKGGA